MGLFQPITGNLQLIWISFPADVNVMIDTHTDSGLYCFSFLACQSKFLCEIFLGMKIGYCYLLEKKEKKKRYCLLNECSLLVDTDAGVVVPRKRREELKS